MSSVEDHMRLRPWSRRDICVLQGGIIRGKTVEEIAQHLGRSLRELEKKLDEIGDIVGRPATRG